MSSIVQIKDSAYDGLQSLRVYGNTVQNLWVNPSGTNNGVTVTSNADGSITLSGTASNQSIVQETSYVLAPGKSYRLSIDSKITDDEPSGTSYTVVDIVFYNSSDTWLASTRIGYGSVLSATFSVPADTAYSRFRIAVKSGDSVSGTYRVMLNEGSTAEPWCPPGLNSVGDGGSVDIVTAGKNICDTSRMSTTQTLNGVTFTNNGDGSFSASGTATGAISYTLADNASLSKYLVPGMTVYVNTKNAQYNADTANMSLRFSMGVGEPSRYIYDGSGVVPKYVSVKFEFWVGSGTTVDLENVYPYVLVGSEDTGYIPFDSRSCVTTIPLKDSSENYHTLNALPDGTRDELHIDGGGNVVLEKRTQKVQLDGDANWYRGETPFVYYFSSWSNFNGLPSGLGVNYYVDKLPASNDVPNGLYSANTNGNIAYVREPIFASDAAGVKTWMGANTPIVIMPLLEPKTIDLGTVDLPKLRKKPLVNNIWANGTAKGTGFSLAPEIDCEYNRWSTYCDGFKTHGKHSYFDMGCCLAARDTGTPEKKSVTATVPYMSGYYDFSKLYGAIAFEARQLTYRFEFVEDSREELQQKKSQFLEWLSQVHDEEIADDDMPGRHFIGSLSEWEFEEGEEGQSGSLEVTFNCQPFLEADEDTTKTCNAGSNTVTVEGQAVNAYAKTSSGTATIQIGGVTQSVGTTEIRLSVQLQPGDNAVTVTGSPVVLRWKELTA